VESVVDQILSTWRHLWRVVVRRRWLALGGAALTAVILATAICLFHDRYEATARVYVDTQTVLKPLMQNLTFQPDIEQQMSMLARTLVTRPNVEKVVALPGMGFDDPDPARHERVVTKLMSDIVVVPAGGGNLYDISYKGTNPETARRLVEAMVNLFMDSGAGDRKRDSQEAGRFIDDQISDYEAKLSAAENRLKDFKVRNFGLTGVSNQDYFSRVSSLTEEVSKLRVDLEAAERSRDAFSRQLADEDPHLPVDAAAGAGFPESGIHARVLEQRKTLDDLQRRYTDSHPDVVNARRVLSDLEQEEKLELAQAKSGAAGVRTGNAATSPVYQRLRISLAEADAQVASLRSQLTARQALLDQTRSAAGRQPEVEAELAQLNRDYDVIRKNYDLLVARRESAALGAKLDESSQLAEFRVVEPPRVRAKPVFPSQFQQAIIALFVSLLAGILAAIVSDRMWPVVDGNETLRRLTGRPVLGSVSEFLAPSVVEARRLAARRFALACAGALGIQIAWVAWIALHAHLT